MGNRAIITTPERKLGVYLHWNGSRDFIEPFCAYCGLKRFRPPSADLGYGTARLVQVIANFFGGGLSVGVVPYTTDADMVSGLDNGVYVIDGWQVTERVFPFVGYAESDVADMAAALHAIDARQPGSERLGAFIDAPSVSVAELDQGYKVWVFDEQRVAGGRRRPGYVPATICGMGIGELNGVDVDEAFIVDVYPGGEKDIRNYLFEDSYRLISRA